MKNKYDMDVVRVLIDAPAPLVDERDDKIVHPLIRARAILENGLLLECNFKAFHLSEEYVKQHFNEHSDDWALIEPNKKGKQ